MKYTKLRRWAQVAVVLVIFVILPTAGYPEQPGYNSSNGGGGVSDHGLLTGLTDDDHTQYFELSQNETVAGIPAFNGGTTGVSAPFSVDSTDTVTNLSCDLLDGAEAVALEESAEIDSDIATHAAIAGAHHAKYTDAECVSAIEAAASLTVATAKPAFNGGTSGVDAPFSVDSTFAVANLNCDLLDGAEAAALEESAEIDSDITTHAGVAGAHHTKYLDSEAVSAIEAAASLTVATAKPAFNGGTNGVDAPFTVDSTFLVSNLNCDLLDGAEAAALEESAEIDSDITTHAGVAGAHHAKYLDSEAVSAIEAAASLTVATAKPAFNGGTSGVDAPFTVDSTFLVSNLNCDTVDGAEASALEESAEIDSDITTHAAIAGAHHTKYLDSEAVSAVEGAAALTIATAKPAFNGGTSGVDAPFTVDSTFAVTNLNCDLLDGAEAAALEESAEIDSDITTHAGVAGAHHAKYLDSEAVSAVEAAASLTIATAKPAFNGGTSGVDAPFTADSTFLVSNLNCDLLDGAEAAALEESAEIDSDITTHAAIAAAHHTQGIISVDGVSNTGGDINLVEGANITITPDDGANTITIAASGGGTPTQMAATAVGTCADATILYDLNGLQVCARTSDAAATALAVSGGDAYEFATVNVGGANVRLSPGIGTRKYTGITQANCATDTITVTINGTANALLEGTNWDCLTDDNTCATALAVAINALSGVSSTASANVVGVKPDSNTRSITLASSDATCATVSSSVNGALELPAANPTGGTAPTCTADSVCFWSEADDTTHLRYGTTGNYQLVQRDISGGATCKKVFGPDSFIIPTSAGPTKASVTAAIWGYAFSPDVVNHIYLNFLAPNKIDSTQNILAQLYWSAQAGDAMGEGETIIWFFDHYSRAEGEAVDGGTLASASKALAYSAGADKQLYLTSQGLNRAVQPIVDGDHLTIDIYRLATHATWDTYTGTATLLSVALSYTPLPGEACN